MTDKKRQFLYALFAVVVASVVFTRWYFPGGESGTFGPQGALPSFRQEGWINGPGPTVDELKGKIVVIDLWAFWCGPCRAAVPDMLKLYKTYGPQGVVFLGATNHGVDDLAKSQAFVKETGIPWPNAYGTEQFFDDLVIEGIPTLLLVNSQGQIVWRGHDPERLESAMNKVLSAKN